jgi:AcrR family transcriptional regulator
MPTSENSPSQDASQGRRSTTRRGADSREHLITAAQELIHEQGVTATSPRQVLQRSGVGQGSYYHHFPTKRDLALAAIGRTAQETLESARRTLAVPTAPATAVEAASSPAAERLHTYLTKDRDAVAGCRVGSLTADPTVMADAELERPVQEYFTGLVDLVRETLEDSGVPALQARERAWTVVAVIQGGYVLSRALGDPGPMDRAVSGLLDLLGIDA